MIPDNVLSIGNYAFESCPNLASVWIGRGVTNIGFQAFAYCPQLPEITVDPNNPALSSVGGGLFDKNEANLLQYLIGNPAPSYALPQTTGSIEPWAFSKASLTSVTLDTGLTNIGDYAFLWCSNLATVTVPQCDDHGLPGLLCHQNLNQRRGRK